ncbi:MAG TPA: L,D-transpeptidase [Longimicrobiaceae bacterium]|nr:L,D-transpeptidase [Longimicrobiaceae bacterium]
MNGGANGRVWAMLLLAAALACGGGAAAQEVPGGAPRDTGVIRPGSIVDSAMLALAVPHLGDRADTLAWMRARDVAGRSTGRRVVISLMDRRLWWITGTDTLLSAPVAVGKGTDLAFAGQRWNFRTPRGRRTVIAKAPNPVWVPPLWRYVEEAARRGDTVAHLVRGRDVRLHDGSLLRIRGRQVQRVAPDGAVETIPRDEEIAYDGAVFIPPPDTDNRRILGELGAFKLELGDGYMIHGSPDQSVIGRPVTHGCIRLATPDLAYLYQHVPVGTPVYVF